MHPTHPKKRFSVFDKDYQGDVFEMFDEAYQGNHSDDMGMIKVMMRPNQNRGLTAMTGEVPKNFAMDTS